MATPGSKHTVGHTPKLGATPPVSTPYSASRLNLSPQHHKKSPAALGHGSFTSVPLGFDSPTAAAFAMADLNYDGLNTSSTGLGATLPAVDAASQDDIKHEKYQSILEILGQVKGKVSEDGIERLARKIGMECLWDVGIGAAQTKTLIIAGTGISVDIDYAKGEIQNVTLNFIDVTAEVQDQAAVAGEILKKDLSFSGPKGNGMERFGRNLQRLSTFDKLSSAKEFNCFEALVGVYSSLNRVYEWEVKKASTDPSLKGALRTPEKAAEYVTYTKSGRPRMNAHDTVGLSLDYWKTTGELPGTKFEDTDKVWSIVIEFEGCPSATYPPARVSTKWVSDAVGNDLLSADPNQHGQHIEWLDPKNASLTADGAVKDANSMEGVKGQTQKPPDVRFLAKFNPPLIVPYLVGEAAHHAVGIEYRPEDTNINSYDELFRPSDDGGIAGTTRRTSGGASAEDDLKQFYAYRCIKADATCDLYDPTTGTMRKFTSSNSIYFKKVEYASVLTELPFSHPRQLVELLPIFRKWARVTSLLAKAAPRPTKKANVDKPKADDDFDSDSEAEEQEDEFIFRSSHPGLDAEKALDIQVLATPEPNIEVHFMRGGERVEVCLEVALNGAIQVKNSNVEESTLKVEMLEKCGDLVMWVEYLKMLARAGGG